MAGPLVFWLIAGLKLTPVAVPPGPKDDIDNWGRHRKVRNENTYIRKTKEKP